MDEPRKRTRLDLRPAAWRAAQAHGAITTRMLIALGYTEASIRRMVCDGILHRKRRGCWAFGTPRLSREGTWHLALMICGRGAALSGLDAAAYWRITRRRSWRWISVVAPRRPRGDVTGIRVSQLADLDRRSVVVEDGLRVVTATWAIVLLARYVRHGELVKMMYQAAYHGVLDRNELIAASTDGSRRPGSPRLRDAISAYLMGDEGSDSHLEDRVKMWLPEIPGDPLRQNIRVETDRGEYRLDLAYERLKIDIEPCGGHHRDKVVARDDAERRAALERAGWTQIVIWADEFDADPFGATAEARDTILAAAARLDARDAA